jgi:Globin
MSKLPSWHYKKYNKLFALKPYKILFHHQTSMIPSCSYTRIDTVIASWEIARQRNSCSELIGLTFLKFLFTLHPETQYIFGFQPEQDVLVNPRMRAGVLVHAQIIVDKVNELFMNIGIDFHDVEWMIKELADYLVNKNVNVTSVIGAVTAVKETIRVSIGKNFDQQLEDSWNEFLNTIAAMTIQFMVQ